MVSSTSPGKRLTESGGFDWEELHRLHPVVEKRPLWPRRLAITLALLAVLTAASWGAARYVNTHRPSATRDMKTAAVLRGDLLVTMKEDGNLESAVNIDIKCEVAGGSAILWIVEDGQQVKKGEKLVELDSSALEEQVNQQKIVYEKARAVMIQAEKDFAAAKIAVQEYLEGTFVKALLDAESNITIASENLRSAQTSLDHSQVMFRKGYISVLDLESQSFAVERAQLELDSANTAKEVLTKYTKEKMLQELQSKSDAAEARVRSEQASFSLEESRLKRLEAQILKCVILAPADGMAVYANETDRHGMSQEAQIEEGAAVRERQTLLRLPDLSQMQVKVNVHESKIDGLGKALRQAERLGQVLPARIEIQGKQSEGRLASIANQPAPPDFRTGNVKQYPTIIAIDGTPEGLRPGMTAKCEVVVMRLNDVLTIPVAAVLEQQGEYVCWVATDKSAERRPLVLGTANETAVEVKDGVSEGEKVIVNPRATVPEARNVYDQTIPTRTRRKLILPSETSDPAEMAKTGEHSEPASPPEK